MRPTSSSLSLIQGVCVASESGRENMLTISIRLRVSACVNSHVMSETFSPNVNDTNTRVACKINQNVLLYRQDTDAHIFRLLLKTRWWLFLNDFYKNENVLIFSLHDSPSVNSEPQNRTLHVTSMGCKAFDITIIFIMLGWYLFIRV